MNKRMRRSARTRTTEENIEHIARMVDAKAEGEVIGVLIGLVVVVAILAWVFLG